MLESTRDELTVREREIAQLVARGRRNAEIAVALRIAPRTVEWNLTRIYRKLGVRSKVELPRPEDVPSGTSGTSCRSSGGHSRTEMGPSSSSAAPSTRTRADGAASRCLIGSAAR